MSGNSQLEKSSFPIGIAATPWSCGLILTLVSTAVGLLTAGVGYAHSGWAGILAAFLAASVCWASAIVSLAVAGSFLGTPQAAYGVLLGTPIRMGVPLLACWALGRQDSRLLDTGILHMMVVNYFVMLIADTWLLRRLGERAGAEPVSRVS